MLGTRNILRAQMKDYSLQSAIYCCEVSNSESRKTKLIETRSNILLVVAGTVYTPEAETGFLSGLTGLSGEILIISFAISPTYDLLSLSRRSIRLKNRKVLERYS